MNIWKILNIEPTDDIKEIKKAYAKLSSQYHPEEYPEEFQQLHDAYDAAMAAARGKSDYFEEYNGTPHEELHQASNKEEPRLWEETWTHPESEPVESKIFDDLLDQRQEELQSKDDIQRILVSMRGEKRLSVWQTFLQSEVVLQYKNHENFQRAFLMFLQEQKPGRKVCMAIWQSAICLDEKGILLNLDHPLIQYLNKRIKKLKRRKWMLIPIGVILGLLIAMIMWLTISISIDEKYLTDDVNEILTERYGLELYMEKPEEITAGNSQYSDLKEDGVLYVASNIDYDEEIVTEFYAFWEGETDISTIKDNYQWMTVKCYAAYEGIKTENINKKTELFPKDNRIYYSKDEIGVFVKDVQHFYYNLQKSQYVRDVGSITVDIRENGDATDSAPIKLVVDKNSEFDGKSLAEQLKKR